MTPRPREPHLVVCLNPTLQRTLLFDGVRLGEVNRAREWREDASGKGVNVARVMTELGQEAIHLTQVGRGERADRFVALCRADGLQVEAVDGGGVRTCTTVIDETDARATELVEEGRPVDEATVARVRERYRDLLGRCGTVVISGSTAPGFPVDLFAHMTAEARDAGLAVVLDIRGPALQRAVANPHPRRPTLVKPNLSEFAQTYLAGRSSVAEHDDDATLLDDSWEAMERLRQAGVATCITRGALPALALDLDGVRIVAEPVRLTPRNTIGCGDAFTAGLVAALADHATFAEAIERAHTAAAMNAASLRPGSIRPARD